MDAAQLIIEGKGYLGKSMFPMWISLQHWQAMFIGD